MKLFTLFIFIMNGVPLLVSAQDKPVADTVKPPVKVKYWDISGTTSLNFNQISFSNWVAGGEDAISGTAGLTLNANYKKNKITFENSGLFSYGLIQSTEQGLRKMEDRLEINSKLNYNAVKSWNYSFLVSLKSQFAPGYNYPDKVDVVSDFFAPAYLLMSLGIDYRPASFFSLFMSPATGRLTFVIDQNLADQGAFGVRKAEVDAQGNIISHGQTVKAEFGMSLNAYIKYEIMKNIVLDSRLILFDNYTDKVVSNRWNVDVDSETNLNFMVNRVFTATINARFLYDDNIKIPKYDMVNGQRVKIGEGPRLQIKEAFGIGMMMKFGSAKKAATK
ncbi:MAG: DUF3078 domain-containing protein [Bacteroidota bacterium]|nr:DUF3078 domain-containing protein [Bacteroidota bacterium]